MLTPAESREALGAVTSEAVATAAEVLARLPGSPAERRLALLGLVPEVIGYYSDGSAALAADFYEEQRELAGVRSAYTAELVLLDRTVTIRRGISWAADPLFVEDELTANLRLAEVVQFNTARPFRDTITGNRVKDSAAVGWRRITSGGCNFCRMLADRGAVYKESTARFASHPNCHCTAQPVFTTNDTGVEASVMQYTASRKNRTEKQRAALRDYLDTFY